MFHRVKVADVWSSDLYVYFTPASTSNKPLLNELPQGIVVYFGIFASPLQVCRVTKSSY